MFAIGTKILTPKGKISVENLKVGDIVFNKDKQEETIKDIKKINTSIYEIITLDDDFLYLSKDAYILTSMIEETHYKDKEFIKVEDLNYDKFLVTEHKYLKIKSIVNMKIATSSYVLTTENNTFIINNAIIANKK